MTRLSGNSSSDGSNGEQREQLELYVLVKQVADDGAWSCGSSAGKDKVHRQLHRKCS